MKKLLSFATILMSITVFANEVVVNSNIKNVTVFLNNAQIERSAKQILEAGTSEIVFSGLSQNIDASSIQVNGKGSFTILSVRHELDYLNQNKKSKSVLILEDSLDFYQVKYDYNEQMKSVYTNEKNMVLSNKNVNNDAGFDIEDLDDLARFYRNRLADISLKELEIKRSQKKLSKKLNDIRNQINELDGKTRNVSSKIIVEVSSKNRIAAQFDIKYMVSGARWNPIYDLRANSTTDPITINYKAQVYQNTGVEWNNVNLTLSTGNPTKNGNFPEINPHKLYFQNYTPTRNSYGMKKQKVAYAPQTNKQLESNTLYELSSNDDEMEMAFEDASFASVQINESQINTNFEISVPYSIPSDNKQHLVSIQDITAEAHYKYFAIPKKDKDAFLLAEITGWNEYNLLSGNANIFFEGTYVGKSYIDTYNTNDTLALSLGRDEGIIIERKRVDEFCESKVISSNKTEMLAYDISVRNNKKHDIEIEIMDQIPVSTNKEIEVKELELSGGKLEEQTGFVTWSSKIPANTNLKKTLKFEVKFPKDKRVNL